MEHSAAPPATLEHYARLADRYDDLWEHSTRFRGWMIDRILGAVGPGPFGVIADIGGGTGIYAQGLLERLEPRPRVFVVDPSPEMLAQLPPDSSMVGVQASASTAVRALRSHGVHRVDLVLIKEAVHHFADPGSDLASLTTLVDPEGCLIVAMLPKDITYPLFSSALERFSALQPDPSSIVAHLEDAGMTVSRERHGYQLRIPVDRWVAMVAGRFMSLLSTFTDEELKAGILEIERAHARGGEVRFEDTFEFITARRAS